MTFAPPNSHPRFQFQPSDHQGRNKRLAQNARRPHTLPPSGVKKNDGPKAWDGLSVTVDPDSYRCFFSVTHLRDRGESKPVRVAPRAVPRGIVKEEIKMATYKTKIGGNTAPEQLYSYCRDSDGVFDVFTICNPRGEAIAHLYYWDEPDTDEGHLAEMSAQLIVANLNRWHFDGWVDVTEDRGRKPSKNARQRKR